MMTKRYISLFFIILCIQFVHAQTKSICITIDDLPVVSTDQSIPRLNYITASILGALKNHNAPAIGFVNEQKLLIDGQRSKDREELLTAWFTSGFELGNHTFSHMDFNSNSLMDFEKDIVNGEIFTNELFKSVKGRTKYFRHPYLHTGNTLDKKEGLTNVVSKLGYIEAPVTIDNADYIFARAFDIALEKKDAAMAKKISLAYVPYMMSKVLYYQNQSMGLFNKNISHILLIHANSINAENLSQLIDALKKEGYQIISLTDALKDPLYKTPDQFIGNAGISWLHRWAITKGKPKDFFGNEPTVPAFVLKYSGFESE